MQWAINDGVYLGQTIDSMNNTGKIQSINCSNDFELILKKLN